MQQSKLKAENHDTASGRWTEKKSFKSVVSANHEILKVWDRLPVKKIFIYLCFWNFM